MLSSAGLQKGDNVYYARVTSDYDCVPLVVHNINYDFNYFTAIERNKKNNSGMTFLFNFNDYGEIVFNDMYDAKDYLEIERAKRGDSDD